MSSDAASGPQQKAQIKQKKKPQYYNDNQGNPEIEKESLVELVELETADAGNVHIGLKIRDNQTIDDFKVLGTLDPTDPTSYTEMALTALTGSALATVRNQLNAISPVTYKSGGTDKSTGEKWVVYKGSYDPAVHGFSFRTELKLKPFDFCPPKGFQVVTTAFTYSTKDFKTDHYLVGTSVLPGKDSDFDHSAVKMSAGKKGKKGKKTKKKAKTKTGKKDKGK